MTVAEVIRASFSLLDRRDRRLLSAAVLVQMTSSLLDLAGVALIGLVGALSVTTIAGQPAPSLVRRLANAVGLGNLPDGTLVAVLAVMAAIVLLAKGVITPLLLSRTLGFLGRREAIVAARLTRELLSRPLTFVQLRSTQETSLALVRGVNAATIKVLGQTVVAASELALITALATSLLLISPGVALGAITYFAAITWGLQRVLGPQSARFGSQHASADTNSIRTVQEAIGAYREIVVSDRRSFYVKRLDALRRSAAGAAARAQFVAMLPKYILEAALVLGAFALAAMLFTSRPPASAAGTFALFLAAGVRVMPSLLRLQSATLSIRAAAGPAGPTYRLAADLRSNATADDYHDDSAAAPTPPRDDHRDFIPTLELQNVNFRYPGSAEPALRDLSLSVPAGRSVAFVGRSGAGKSTLADVILGVSHADSGLVRVGGVPAAQALHRWPGAIAYVPQQVMLVDDSVRANVALGLPEELVADEEVWEALDLARLGDFIREKPEGLDSPVGERGVRLSGGQRQRIGIARALLTRPRLLVLDEATSSLDAETEWEITEILDDLKGVTRVIVAHRLTTVQSADLVVHLEEGAVSAVGTFDEVCSANRTLRRQAKLMGLKLG